MGELLNGFLGNFTALFWATLQLYSGKLYGDDLGSLTYIGWESRRGTLAAGHASCPGCVCEDSPRFPHPASGRKQALAIGQVAASAVRMCGHARQAPALRLLAQELGVLLSEPRTRPV